MVRRIAAIALALTILISVIPAGAFAEDDHIYDIGETIWVTGIGNAPTAQTVENGQWTESIGPDGQQVKQPGCTKEIHEHTPAECWDAVLGLVCPKEEHTARQHSLLCSFLESKYQWVVITKETGGGEGIGPGGSGDGEARGKVYFTIHNIDPLGNPLSGTTFLLVEEDEENGLTMVNNGDLVTDLQKTLDEKNQENLEKIEALQQNPQKNQEAQEAAQPEQSMEQLIEQLNEENLKTAEELQNLNHQFSPVTTDENGNAYFNGLEQYMESSMDTVTWYLVQNSDAFLEGAPLYETHLPSNQKWQITITRTGTDSYDMSITLHSQSGITPEATEYQEGYDPGTGILTFINQRNLCKMGINVAFEGMEKLNLDDFSASVLISGPDGFDKTITFPVNAAANSSAWQHFEKALQPGFYTITAQNPAPLVVNGYTWESTSCKVRVSNDEAVEGNTATLSADSVLAVFTVTYRYKPIEVPEHALNIRMLDGEKNLIRGGTVQLQREDGTLVKEFSGEAEYVLENLTEFVQPGTIETFTLKETKAPDGYYACEDVYHIEIDRINGSVALKKDGNILQQIFGQSNLRNADGTWNVEFIHEKVPEIPEYQIRVKMCDDGGNLVKGGTLLLKQDGGTFSKELSGQSEYVIRDLEDHVPVDSEGSFTLQETAAPEGYGECKDVYTITINRKNGSVTLKKNGNMLGQLFGQKLKRDDEGNWNIEFAHEPLKSEVGLTCLVTANVNPTCWDAEDTKNEFEAREHEFLLEWSVHKGPKHVEKLKLENGETKQFRKEIPYGAKYKIIPMHAKEFNYTFSGANEGTFDGKPLALTANIQYDISRGQNPNLYFTKVDSSTKKPLASASFSLKNGYGQEIAVYTTAMDGAVRVENIISMPGLYTLHETKAPDQYDVLRKPIEINMRIAYEPVYRGGRNVMEQYLTEEVVHKSVTMGDDETYWIKNTASNGNPKTGDDFNLMLWTGMMTVSMLGLVTVIASSRKRRVKRGN